MTALALDACSNSRTWRGEIRAMLALGWPMVLTNLGQVAMNATDVMMMGRLGPTALAGGALGANLYFLPMIFGLGLMLATSPMMASELGRNRHSVRDVRRTVRQGLWVAALISAPIWLFLWNAEAVLLAMGRKRTWRRRRASMFRLCNGACCRFTVISCCARSSRLWSGPAGRSSSWRPPSFSTFSPTGA